MNDETKDFLTLQEVTAYLGVSDSTIYRYLNRYKKPLPSMKISRKKILIKKVDLDKWLEELKIVTEDDKELSERNKIKRLARATLQKAIKEGTVVRKPCTVCGNEKSEGHHEDYNKPLEVIWLCSECHLKIHKKSEGKVMSDAKETSKESH